MKKNWVAIGIIGFLVIGGGYWGYKHFTAKTVAAPTVVTGQVKIGDVRQTISTTGTVDFLNSVDLSFTMTGNNASGKLVELNVQPGDKVTKGEVLAKLDTTDLELSVKQQEAKVAMSQAQLQRTMSTAAIDALSSAQKSYINAQQALQTAEDNADPSYLANQVDLAQQGVTQANDNLTQAKQSGDQSAIQSAQAKLTQAQRDLDSAKRQQKGLAAQTLESAQLAYKSAKLDLDQAQSQYDDLQKGKATTDVLSAQANLLDAQATLATDQANLANATITAPGDGVIVAVTAQKNETVAGNKAIITMALGENMYKVDTVIDQADISSIKVGQKADITLDTMPDLHVAGTVTQVSLQGTANQNVTTYDVTINLDEPNTTLRAGMNTNVNIITAEATGVLTVPSEAVRTLGNRSFVLVPGAAQGTDQQNNTTGSGGNAASGDGTTPGSNRRGTDGGAGFAGRAAALGNIAGVDAHLVPVEVGLDDGTNAEITSGLTEGQEIIVSVRTAATSSSSSQARTTGSSPFGGGGSGLGQLNRSMGGGSLGGGGTYRGGGSPAGGN